MEFRVLGPLEVWQDGRPVQISAPRQRSLLVLLLLHANQVVARDDLIERLWDGAAPKTARAVLQNAVSGLRRTLGADVLETVPPGYRLNVEVENLDSLRFVELVDEARDAEPDVRAKRLRDALAYWRGPPLSEYPFVENELRRLEEIRLIALEGRIDADLALGRAADLVPELEALVASTPLRERFWEQLMLALYRSRRQAEALSTYRRAHEVFTEELGIEPGFGLKELQRAILVQDKRLDTMARVDGSDLLERAAPLLPTSFAGRAQSLYEYGLTLRRLGERGRALALFDKASDQARIAGDTSLEELIHVTRSQYEVWAGTKGAQEALRETERSISVFERAGDDRKLAKALLVRGSMLAELGSTAAGEPDLRRAIELAHQAGDRWQEGWIRNMIAFNLWVDGPIAVEDAVQDCNEHLAALDWRPPGPLGLWVTLGHLHAQAGRSGEAISWGRRAIDAMREAGVRGEMPETRRRFAATLALNGDDVGAEVELRAAHDLLTSIDPADAVLSCIRAELAVLAYRRGELSEAETLAAAARHAATNLEGELRWRVPTALVEARCGRESLALELAEESVALAAKTDWLNMHALALETLGSVSGRRSAFDQALELYLRKGNLSAAAELRRLEDL
ncbi:MAG TPA: AfsR/SARP family transcriptional regulator [Gaiellaceae bacterium]|nr:AfsR/SARP family transcriptional regulator [Gaiellaceae bacterium]